MTNRNYYTNKNYDTKNIPNHDEFHRFASNVLSENDFCTYYNAGTQASKVAQSLNWTYKNKRKEKRQINESMKGKKYA